MTQQNNSEWQNLSLLQKTERVQLLALYPALAVLVFCRSKIGFRVVKPLALYIMAALMIVGAVILPVGGKTGIVVYAISMVAMGLFHRHARWLGICRGEKRHTQCTGDSFWELIPFLPAFFQRERRIHRFLDPLMVFIIAGLVWLMGIHGVALCLLVAGTALMVWEQGYYDRVLNRILDLYDGGLDAQMQQMIIREHGKQPRQIAEASAIIGYPSGIGSDIYGRIQDMLQKNREAAAGLSGAAPA